MHEAVLDTGFWIPALSFTHKLVVCATELGLRE